MSYVKEESETSRGGQDCSTSNTEEEAHLKNLYCVSCGGMRAFSTKPMVLHRDSFNKPCCYFFPDKNVNKVPFCSLCCGSQRRFKDKILKYAKNKKIARKRSNINLTRTTTKTKKPRLHKVQKPWYSSTNTSKFRGVSWHKRDKRYVARFSLNGKSKHIGNYHEELRAALAVDHAVLNSPLPDPSKINFTSGLERTLAELVLKHYNRFKYNPEENKDMYMFTTPYEMDYNGYPNDLQQILRRILGNDMVRQNLLCSEQSKEQEKGCNEEEQQAGPTRWTALLDAVRREGDKQAVQAEAN